MKDFELSQGKMEAGLKGAIFDVLAYAVVPFLLLTFFSSMMGGSPDPDERALSAALLQVRTALLLLSLPVILLRFFSAYYFKGTRSRLAFGIAGSFAVLAYAYVLFLGEGLQQAVSAVGVELDLSLFFVLAAIGAVLQIMGHVGTYISHWAGWLKSVGLEDLTPPFKARTGLAEFGTRNGDFCMGNATARGAAVRYALLPSMLFALMLLLMSISDYAQGPAQLPLLEALRSMEWGAVLLAIPLIALAWLRGYYPRGTISRLSFGALSALFLSVYIYVLLIGSGLQAGLQALGLTLDLGQVFLLLLLLVAFLLLKYVGEMADERRMWRQRVGLPVKERRMDPQSRSADLDPRYGRFEHGFREAQRALLSFIVVPVIVLAIGVAVLAKVANPTLSIFVLVLQDMGGVALLFGIPIVALAFGRGFYPKGCLGRLLFSLAAVLFVAFYVLALLLGGRLEAAFADAGLPLDLDAIWAFLLVLVAFRAVTALAETADFRREWKASIGRKVLAVAEEERHGMLLDFRPRYGRFVAGAKEARSAAKKYLVVPSIIVIVMIAALQAVIDSLSVPQLSSILDDLRAISAAMVLFALPVIALTFMRGFYPKGAFSRLVFAWATCGALALWLWSVALGGRLATDLEMQGVTVGLQLDVSGVILIFVVLELLWSLYHTAEFLSYRKDWIANRFQPVNDDVRRRAPERPALKA